MSAALEDVSDEVVAAELAGGGAAPSPFVLSCLSPHLTGAVVGAMAGGSSSPRRPPGGASSWYDVGYDLGCRPTSADLHTLLGTALPHAPMEPHLQEILSGFESAREARRASQPPK